MLSFQPFPFAYLVRHLILPTNHEHAHCEAALCNYGHAELIEVLTLLRSQRVFEEKAKDSCSSVRSSFGKARSVLLRPNKQRPLPFEKNRFSEWLWPKEMRPPLQKGTGHHVIQGRPHESRRYLMMKNGQCLVRWRMSQVLPMWSARDNLFVNTLMSVFEEFDSLPYSMPCYCFSRAWKERSNSSSSSETVDNCRSRQRLSGYDQTRRVR